MDVEKLKAQRVEACIEDVMRRFRSDSKNYYVEVHQHLAPLARELERNNDALLAEIAELRSALASSTAAGDAVPPGWKLVPIELTPEMLSAYGTCPWPQGQEYLNESARQEWTCFLAAAPSPPNGEKKEEPPCGS